MLSKVNCNYIDAVVNQGGIKICYKRDTWNIFSKAKDYKLEQFWSKVSDMAKWVFKYFYSLRRWLPAASILFEQPWWSKKDQSSEGIGKVQREVKGALDGDKNKS